MDDLDKTVFKQPMPGGDRTVMRSRSVRAPVQNDNLKSTTTQQPLPDISAQRAADFSSRFGLNPLTKAASTLITVFAKTRHTLSHNDVAGLHHRLVREIKNFDDAAREDGVRPEIVLASRYLLCTVLDEAVMNTPWGSESSWSQRSLLSVFHGETSGGEKCYQLLQRLRQSPAENLDFIELFYICICLGFEGRYRVASAGRDQLLQLKDDLFETIRRYRGDYERALSEHWQGLGKLGRSLGDYLPMWVAASIAAAVLFFGYSGFRYWLQSSANPVVVELQHIASEQDSRGAKP